MIYLPPLRRLLLPALLFLAFILWYRSAVRLPRTHFSSYLVRQPEITGPGETIPISDIGSGKLIYRATKENHLSPPSNLYYPYNEPGTTFANGTEIPLAYQEPAAHKYLQKLLECPFQPNPHTQHIRFSNPLYNISLIVKNETMNERKGYLNPAIISLPHWSENQYLLISRVATDGSHQENLICEANICTNGEPKDGERKCDEESLKLLGGSSGMRCATPPLMLNVPPTPAETCEGGMGILSNIPGFHDPRVFWSGRGEPLMMVNSQSRYACFGLWVIDLRRLYWPLTGIVSGEFGNPGPLMSYPSLTEITRNPKDTRGKIEKNWMFFSSREGSYIHYDMGPTKRTFAKLLGGGLTTVNLTDPAEVPCLEDAVSPNPDGTWHQGTNSLRLVLCSRRDPSCVPNDSNQVFFSLIHHKHKSFFDLPLRYERYFIVWSATPPFSMLGITRHPLLFANETANGFTEDENWAGDEEHEAAVKAGKPGKKMFANFTYTVSIAWNWGRNKDRPEDKNLGYLDDEVLLGVGIDDKDMNYAIIKAQDLLSCLRTCPGRGQPPPEYKNVAAEEEEEAAAAAAKAKAESSSGDAAGGQDDAFGEGEIWMDDMAGLAAEP